MKMTTSRPAFRLKLLPTRMALVLGLIAPAAQALDLDYDLGADYRATAFYVQSDALDAGGEYDSDNDNGLAHLLRLKGTVEDQESGVSLHASVELAGDRWSGDVRGYETTDERSYNRGSRSDNVRLDQAYVQVPVGDAIARIGRMSASFNNCFLVCDDRRDRVLVMLPTERVTLISVYDRRADTSSFFNQDNGDLLAFGGAGKVAGWTAELIYIHWFNNFSGDFSDPVTAGAPAPFVLQDLDLFSGRLAGSLGDIANMTLGATWTANGKADLADDGRFFVGQSWSGYFRIGQEFGALSLDAQYVATRDGGLISPGFDTYAGTINSNPDATNSPNSLYRMGGAYGLRDLDEDLIIGRIGYQLTPEIDLAFAVGQLTISSANDDDESMVYDLNVGYQATDRVRVWSRIGMLEANHQGSLASNSLVGSLPTNSFADDDLLTASLNLSVEF
ncbi:hypothetical protein [Marinobacter daepoensis]|uniref:hypothetical protein n=1 Tax=Marinobacter daepoensis TaxID=262077 RepID=UPI0003FC27F4|nr:hypothetical protein [Marinobacter daepoensis]MBY6032918.1 hypothetical protein [Marinobacter daepoensis]